MTFNAIGLCSAHTFVLPVYNDKRCLIFHVCALPEENRLMPDIKCICVWDLKLIDSTDYKMSR